MNNLEYYGKEILMAVIKPFRALRYNPDKVGDLSKVMAPPYDVISPEFQQELYLRHPNNIIRLILGKTLPGDKPGNDRYARAAEHLEKWQKEGVFVRDITPSIYFYTQEYKLKSGMTRTRKGFIALSKLEEFGKGAVMPHERTLSGPKADRLELMKACRANLSCIFALYPEAEGVSRQETISSILLSAAKGEPIIEVVGDDGVVNRLWKIDDAEVIGSVTEAMKDKSLFIADGHHRYETALNYRNLMLEATKDPTGEEPFNYVMMYFASMDDEGLDIFPTHRVVHSLRDFDAKGFLAKCREYFDVEEFPLDDKQEATQRELFLKKLVDNGGRIRFGLYVNGINAYYLLTLKSSDIMDKVFGSTIPDEYKVLDVTVLHALVLDRLLGIGREAQERQENLIYIKDMDEALEQGKAGANQLTFLMNPTKIKDVRKISEARLLMPQKSTYFYPKLLSGLTINPLWD